MSRIRVLVVDDSVVIRRLVTNALGPVSEIEVVGAAPNGRIALERIPKLKPDLVVLDVEMPDMDGLETLSHIRKTHPTLPVIMFSSLTEKGASVTLEALARGASDYVAKPHGSGSLDESLERVRADLAPRIKALVSFPGQPSAALPPISTRPRTATKPAAPTGAVHVVTIGTSTGGPNALADLLGAIPSDFQTPILIVQHMPPVFTRLLAERLAARTKLDVREATHGARVEPGTIWIAPGDHHMRVKRQGTDVLIELDQAAPENSCRPAVDVLFRSVSEVYGRHALAIVLTGMGQDGTRGAERIVEAGGRVIAQDEATSVVWGMPGFVVKHQLADVVLPLPAIAPEILHRVVPARHLSRAQLRSAS